MGAFMVPQIGSGVWILYEGGDPDHPVWVGGWWGSVAEVPALALAGVPGDPNIVIQTTLQNAIVMSDLPGPTGGIMLKSTTGATIIVNDTGIFIQNGKGASIVMVGPSVTITLHLLATVPTDDLAVAGMLADKGCTAQLGVFANAATPASGS